MLSYAYEIATLMAIFIVASLGLALIVSQAGLMSLCHGAFVGLGAYAYAILSTHSGWPMAATVAAAIILPAVIGILLSYFGFEFDEEQFAVATLAFNILFVNILINWPSLTGGLYGISQIPRANFVSTDAPRVEFLVICVVVAVAVYVFLSRLAASGFGTLLRASAHERAVVEALGASVIRLRMTAVAIGCAIAGIAGALYAMHASYIAPQLFELHLSILLLAMVMIGANGSMAGTALGAALLVLIPELLRFIATSPTSVGPIRQVVFGSLLLAVIFVQAWRRSRQREAEQAQERGS